MIKLNKINKYFNRNKKNENHVLKDITLEFPERGFIVILGKSGSGKTSLLNVMSGCDRFNSGEIIFNGILIKKHQKRVWNTIRNEQIGYIYQNFNLLTNLSVEENIALVLRMNGVIDQNEIERKVSYTLSLVGLKEYNKRVVDTLSGGQQQRVAFARSIVKDPTVIVADEPTGNLDSKSALEVMNALKKVSKQKLVVMVTHDEELAAIYADRIITIVNGEIYSDEVNSCDNAVSLYEEQKIYLKDLHKEESKTNGIILRSYSDRQDERSEIDLIKRNGTLYIKVDSSQYKRIKNIDHDSEIELINDSSDNIVRNLDSDYEYDKLKNERKRVTNQIITTKEAFRITVQRLKNLSKGAIALLLLLGLLGGLLGGSIGLIGKVKHYDDTQVLTKPKNFITVDPNKLFHSGGRVKYTIEDVFELSRFPFVKGISLIDEKKEFDLATEIYYQTSKPVQFEAFPADVSLLSEEAMIYGAYPEKGSLGIVVDKEIAQMLITKHSNKGVDSFSEVLKCSLLMHSSKVKNSLEHDANWSFNIVGIADTGSPTIWMSEDLIYTLVMSNLVAQSVLEEGLELIDGKFPEIKNEVLVHKDSDILTYKHKASVGLATGIMTVSGVYSYTKDGEDFNTEHLYVTSLELLKRNYLSAHHKVSTSGATILLYVDDPESAIVKLAEEGIDAYSDYIDDLRVLDEVEQLRNANFYTFALAGIVLTAVCVLFIMRTNLLTMINDISIYRLLGASNRDLRRLFIVDIFVVTSLTSLIGYILMIIMLINTQNSLRQRFELVHYDLISVVAGIALLYLMNLLFGLLPINTLLLKSPSQIQKKYDL